MGPKAIKNRWDWIKSVTPDAVGRWLTAFGGRRFMLTLLVQVETWYLAYHQLISDSIYRDVVLATSAVYIASGTYQKVKQTSSAATVEVAEITGEAPVTNNIGIDGVPIKVELSTKPQSGVSVSGDADGERI
jgi:hypothetical protein